MQMDRYSTSSEISFHGLPSNSKCPSIRKQIASSFSSQLIVLLFLRNSHLQRYLANIFSTVFDYYLNFQKILAAHQRNILKFFRKFTKKHPWQSLILVKLQVFCKKRCSQKGVRKIHRKTRQSLRPKAKKKASSCKKETPAQVLSCEFCEISKNTSFTEYFRTLLLLTFQKQPPEVFHEKKFS